MSVVLVFNVRARKIVITVNTCSLIESHIVHLTVQESLLSSNVLFCLRFVSDQSLTSPIIFLVKNNLTS